MFTHLHALAAAPTYLRRQLFVHAALAIPATAPRLAPAVWAAEVLPALAPLAEDGMLFVCLWVCEGAGACGVWPFCCALVIKTQYTPPPKKEGGSSFSFPPQHNTNTDETHKNTHKNTTTQPCPTSASPSHGTSTSCPPTRHCSRYVPYEV